MLIFEATILLAVKIPVILVVALMFVKDAEDANTFENEALEVFKLTTVAVAAFTFESDALEVLRVMMLAVVAFTFERDALEVLRATNVAVAAFIFENEALEVSNVTTDVVTAFIFDKDTFEAVRDVVVKLPTLPTVVITDAEIRLEILA